MKELRHINMLSKLVEAFYSRACLILAVFIIFQKYGVVYVLNIIL
jgi:hypothetical protein